MLNREININSSAKQSIDNASVTKNAYIEIKNASGEIAEYSYSFYVTVNANGIYTATFEDTKGHKNKVTQTIDTFKAEALEVKYTVQDPTVYREYAVVTFSANRPVKLVSPESYKDIIDKVGNGEYANKYTLNVYDEMSDIVFEFVDKRHVVPSFTNRSELFKRPCLSYANEYSFVVSRPCLQDTSLILPLYLMSHCRFGHVC